MFFRWWFEGRTGSETLAVINVLQSILAADFSILRGVRAQCIAHASIAIIFCLRLRRGHYVCRVHRTILGGYEDPLVHVMPRVTKALIRKRATAFLGLGLYGSLLGGEVPW